MKDNLIEEIGDCIKNNKFFDLRDPLKKKKFKVDYHGEPIPHYRLQKSGMKFLVCNKKYVDNPENVIGEIAYGEE